MTVAPKTILTPAQEQTRQHFIDQAERYDLGQVTVTDIPDSTAVIIGALGQAVMVLENGRTENTESPGRSPESKKDPQKAAEKAKRSTAGKKGSAPKTVSGSATPEARKLGTRDGVDEGGPKAKPSTGTHAKAPKSKRK